MCNSVGALGWLLHRFGVPDGWNSVVVDDLAHVVGGATPSRSDFGYWVGGTIPWLTPSDITGQAQKWIEESAERITQRALDECSCTLLPAGTVLYTSRATIGAKAIAKVPVTTNQGFASFIPKDGVNGEFLYYFLEHLTPVFIRLAAGTTFLEVSKRDIRKVRCAIPRHDEQLAIAKVLGAIDAVILQVQGNLRIREATTNGRSLIDAYATVRGGLIWELMTGATRLQPERVMRASFKTASIDHLPSAGNLRALHE
jgi:type I restriction enzyme S subunit